jgi:hypothetical protein
MYQSPPGNQNSGTKFLLLDAINRSRCLRCLFCLIAFLSFQFLVSSQLEFSVLYRTGPSCAPILPCFVEPGTSNLLEIVGVASQCSLPDEPNKSTSRS